MRQISRSHGTKNRRIERFRAVTQFWNYAQILTQHTRCALFFVKVIHEISRSHGRKKMPILTPIEPFRTVTPVWIHRWMWNDAQSLIRIDEVPYYFSRSSIQLQWHTGWKKGFESNFSTIIRPVAAIKSIRFALFIIISNMCNFDSRGKFRLTLTLFFKWLVISVCDKLSHFIKMSPFYHWLQIFTNVKLCDYDSPAEIGWGHR